MATSREVLEEIKLHLEEPYERSVTYSVPKKPDLTFGNTVKELEHAKVFYIDMRKSRKILTDATDFWSIKIHKAFLRAVIHSIGQRGGHLRSFNGDGILAFFTSDEATTRAVRAAMDIKGFVNEINSILAENDKNKIDFGIGIAQGPIMIAKSGKAGDDQTMQDLIWIGTALYLAVELSELGKSPKNIWISDNVFSSVLKEGDSLNTLKNKGEWIWFYEYQTLNNGNQKVHHTTWYFNI